MALFQEGDKVIFDEAASLAADDFSPSHEGVIAEVHTVRNDAVRYTIDVNGRLHRVWEHQITGQTG
ncbi:hypothetical protein H1V43_33740 [Streptomyces sp. PSKA54]|uniref:Uncharacterized protein n=1 Tax=Streptomyces himalayensis subsp. aureolus TaxID=2758039 RepID=A0A7W2D7R6_9ACTN|nr:hypothetical protein [Streptomyces himalayensis]MBA4866199.1 hypothetical protein [Streptomyces himalayensis subsp. aureolus]